MTIAQALNKATKKLQTRQISSARLDAEVLLGFILKKPREYLLAHDEKNLSDSLNTKFVQLINRRRKYEPIAYIIGQKEFYGLNIIKCPAPALEFNTLKKVKFHPLYF